jgi:hypothetical protein
LKWCAELVRNSVASLAFLKPDFENLALFEVVWLYFFWKIKPDDFWLFSGFISAVWLFFFCKKKPERFLVKFWYFLGFFGELSASQLNYLYQKEVVSPQSWAIGWRVELTLTGLVEGKNIKN